MRQVIQLHTNLFARARCCGCTSKFGTCPLPCEAFDAGSFRLHRTELKNIEVQYDLLNLPMTGRICIARFSNDHRTRFEYNIDFAGLRRVKKLIAAIDESLVQFVLAALPLMRVVPISFVWPTVSAGGAMLLVKTGVDVVERDSAHGVAVQRAMQELHADRGQAQP